MNDITYTHICAATDTDIIDIDIHTDRQTDKQTNRITDKK